MDKFIQMKLPLTREEISVEEARRRIEEINEPYKVKWHARHSTRHKPHARRPPKRIGAST